MSNALRVAAPPVLGANAGWRAAGLRALGCGLALGVAAAATVDADAARWFGLRGPHCLVGACLGPDGCPGCGLVRATAAAVHGDLAFAFRMHPAGIAVALLLAVGLLLNLDILRRRAERPFHRLLRRLGHRAFVVAVLGGWLLRILVL